MAVLLRVCAAAAALVTFPAHVGALLVAPVDSDCNRVVFDRTDAELHVRTMVVEDSNRQRMLVLTAENDTSMPCKPRWWLDHNPQGAIQCVGGRADDTPAANAGTSCIAAQCKADAGDVQLGYVRTMLASVLFVPQPHTMAAICIELGCRSRIRRQRIDTLLETTGTSEAPAVQWVPRSRVRKVLIIGLGSSTMALWIRQQLPDTELHVAELVPAVAAAAPCFGLDSASGSDKKLHLHVGDGRAVLQGEADGQYDAILIDAFDHDASLPACFRTSEFFAMVSKKLLPGGAVSFNLYTDGHSKQRLVKALMNTFNSSRIWVGNAPGAEGIQEVITAFAPGRTLARVGGKPNSPDDRARGWWGRAKYRNLKFQALHDVKAFEDATECPDKNTLHHG